MKHQILEFTWDDIEPNHIDLLAMLFDEYVRRTILWSKKLNIDWSHPFVDYASLIDSEIRASNDLLDILKTRKTNNIIMNMLFEFMLHWDALRQSRETLLYFDPDIYEPLIKFYLRGGLIIRRNGGVDICTFNGNTRVRIFEESFYTSKTPLLDISNTNLNKLHEKFQSHE